MGSDKSDPVREAVEFGLRWCKVIGADKVFNEALAALDQRRAVRSANPAATSAAEACAVSEAGGTARSACANRLPGMTL